MTLSTSFKMQVSASIKGEKKKKVLGVVAVPFPTLQDLGLNVEPVKVAEDGTPEYETDILNFIQTAILERTKGIARNKLVSGTIQLKDGAVIAVTLADLAKPSVAGGNGEALKALTTLKRAFKAFVAAAGVSERGQGALCQLFGSPNGIAIQSPAIKGKLAQRVEAFADWLPNHEETIDGVTAMVDVTAGMEAYLIKVLDAAADTAELDVEDF